MLAMLTSSRPRLILSVSVIGAVAIAAWLLLAMPTGNISAQEILEDARDNNSAVKTYKFTIDLWQTPQIEGDPPRYEAFTEAVVVFNQGMHVVTRGNDSYSESLLKNGRQYQRDNADDAWEEHQSNFDSSEMVTLDSTKHFQIVNDLVDSTIVGEETLRDVQVTKITGGFDLQERAQDIWGDSQEQDAEGSQEPRQQMLAGSEEFVGWVGIEDGLIHAYEVSGSYPAEGELLPFEFWYRVDFSEFNEPLTLPSVE